MSPQFQYRPEIDGLRAIAVLGVVLYHLDYGVPGGYVGVDVFFVISGYLITTLIAKDLRDGNFSLVQFWKRRALRIVPAASVMLFVILIVAYWLLVPKQLINTAQSALSYTAISSNIYFWRGKGYFNPATITQPLLHTWSLAIEEQFYIGYPILLVLVAKFRKTSVTTTLALLSIASFALCVYGTIFHQWAAFFLLPTRAWELLAGGVIASWRRTPQMTPATKELLAVVGLTCIAFAMIFYDKATRFPGTAALLPVLGAALTIVGTHGSRGFTAQILAIRPLVFIGIISYSLYLWHWPLIVLTKPLAAHFPLLGRNWFLATLSLTCATLSWRFVETPFRKLNAKVRFHHVAAGALVVQGGLAAFSGWYWMSKGALDRFPAFAEQYRLAQSQEFRSRRISVQDIETMNFPVMGDANRKGVDFIYCGDSHAYNAAPLVHNLAKKHGLKGHQIVDLGWAPIPHTDNSSSSIRQTTLRKRAAELTWDYIRTSRVKHVILLCRWSAMTEGTTKFNVEIEHQPKTRYMLHDSETQERSPADACRVLRQHFFPLLKQLSDAGVHVYIIEQSPEAHPLIQQTSLLSSLWNLAYPYPVTTMEEHLARQRNIRTLFRELNYDNVKLLDPTPWFFEGDSLRREINGVCCYADGDHLSHVGVNELLGPLLKRLFSSISSRRSQKPDQH